MVFASVKLLCKSHRVSNEAYLHRRKSRLALNVCKRAIKVCSNESGAALSLPVPRHIFFLGYAFFFVVLFCFGQGGEIVFQFGFEFR